MAETPVEEQVDVPTRHVLRVLQNSLPKLQSLSLDQRSDPDMFQREENEDEHDGIRLLQQFSELRHFRCVHAHPSPLRNVNLSNIFANWSHLQSLNLHGNEQLEWTLSDLCVLKHLKDVRLINNHRLQGDTWDLLYVVLCHEKAEEQWNPTDIYRNLEILDISGCTQVTGKLRHFAPLPKLQWLGINRTGVQGDLRTDVRPGDFAALQGIGLCSQSVYGADTIGCVQDAEPVMRARLAIMKQSTWESPIWPLLVHLSPDSPDYHERLEQRLYKSERDPPFSIEVVVVGQRLGWRWSNYLGGFCDTHWVDPEPEKNDDTYWQEIADFEAQKSMFSGFLDPPTPQQYMELCRDHLLRESMVR